MSQPARRLRIALTTRIPVTQAGGLEASVRELAPRIAERRPSWDVRVVSAFSGVSAWNRLPFLGDLFAAVRLSFKLAEYDAVLVNGAEYAWPRMFRRKERDRTVVVWHGTRVGEIPALVPKMSIPTVVYYHLEKLLQRFALRARAHIAVSENTAHEIRDAYGPIERVRVVPNGAPNLAPIPRLAVGRRVAWIGTNAYKKGLDIALEACRLARWTIGDLELVIIGIEPASSAIDTGVTYVGRVDHARSIDYLRTSDVLLATSRYEGCSVAVLEALSIGLPIVAGPAVGWMIGEAGIAVDDFDSRNYARALEAIFLSPTTITAMSVAATARARRFDWEAAAEEYVREVELCLAS
jgi:glycosyltransferase involved in cell wall biosynthesis